MIPKTEWRKILIEKRKAISKERRNHASQICFSELKSMGRTLSFSPIGSEIDLTLLNEYLSQEGRLFLVSYQTDSLLQIPFDQIDCILVPGLGFDREMYRIGFGKGYYDRLLAKANEIPTIGVGFKEQFCEELLPRDPWDLPVKELFLV